MNLQLIGRIVSIVIAAGVLFGLQQGLGQAFYIAFPAALVAYTLARLAFALMGTRGQPSK
jgi:hypothetical protein